jgi:menaquinone-specific isochorismate synthase
VESVIATSLTLDTLPDLIAIGSRTGLLWSRDGVQFAGLGEAFRITVAGLGHADQPMKQLAAIEVDDASTASGFGTGPIAFGALPFDPQAPGSLVVPEIVLGHAPDGRRWITIVAPEGEPIDSAAALHRIGIAGSRPVPEGPEPTSFDLVSTLPPEIWRDEVVGFARSRIAAGELDKVVLARELVLRTDHPIDPAYVLQRLYRGYQNAILFSVDGFIGASPELLVSRIESIVRAHPLAGTAPRSSDPAEDQRSSARLLSSDKDRWEHRITIEWLLNNLLPFCSFVDAEPEPTIVTLANVHHLGTRVEGRLSSPPANVLELVGALHPTPAVGGQPQDRALSLISAMERMERGRYAGPAGWIDGNGNGEFAVGIRSAQIDGNEARLWAGVGVVADSDPVAELSETRAKFQAMLSALMRP